MPVASFGGRKVRALLRILVTRRGCFLPHDVLAERLWPDRLPADPAANLQVLVNRARRAVGRPDLILTGPGGYALTAEPWLASTSTSTWRTFADAPGSPVSRPCGPIERRWPSGTRSRWPRTATRPGQPRTWRRSSRHVSPPGSGRRPWPWRAANPLQAVEWARAAHRAEPLREVAALALVQALAAAGDPAAALSTLASYRRRLADELGVDASPAAEELQLRLLRSEVAPTPASPEPSSFVELPFVGREAELTTVRRRLRPETGNDGRSPSPARRARASPGCWPRSHAPARPSPSRRSGPTGTSPGRWDGRCSARSRRPTSRR